MNAIRHVVFRGRVQGIGFRAFVENEAMRRPIEGWVRNRLDGSVEAVFGGEEADVAAMIEACRKGPPGARVDGVDVREASVSELRQCNPAKGFDVRPTA